MHVDMLTCLLVLHLLSLFSHCSEAIGLGNGAAQSGLGLPTLIKPIPHRPTHIPQHNLDNLSLSPFPGSSRLSRVDD